MEIIPEIERLNREVERLMEAQKEREIEQKLMAQMEEKEKERRQFYLEIIKAFIAEDKMIYEGLSSIPFSRGPEPVTRMIFPEIPAKGGGATPIQISMGISSVPSCGSWPVRN